MTKQSCNLTASAITLIAAALLLLGPAAQHPSAGPVTDVLMWTTLLSGLLLPAMQGTNRRQTSTASPSVR